MNSLDLANYYTTNKHEFMGEDGHEKLLIGLKTGFWTFSTHKAYEHLIRIMQRTK